MSTKSFAATTVLSDITNISQIEAHGNVEVYISNGETNNVKVYDSYYNQNALVQEQNGTLRISSYKSEKLVVWVTTNSLSKVSAYDNAEIKSFGKLSAIDLSVTLNNNATAQLDLDVYSSKIALNDNAKAKISGYAAQSNIELGQTARVSTLGLVVDEDTNKQSPIVMASMQDEDLAIIE